MDAIRLYIADDHNLFRDGLRALFQSIDDVSIVGETSDGQVAITEITDLQPDVVLMDIQMPGVNGIEATRRINTSSPHIGIIILTMFDDDDSVFAAMRAGARGYILKGADQHEMLRTIRAVSDGEALFGAQIADRLMDFFADLSPQANTGIFPELTDREHEVLELIARGHNNQEIARQLVIAHKTVRNHVSNIFSKLQVADRAQAIIRARDAGMGRSTEKADDSHSS
jgi:DNA-binding NarL/FixJ family response regulator